MLVGSMAIGLCAGGGFCAGSQNVIDHQVRQPIPVHNHI